MGRGIRCCRQAALRRCSCCTLQALTRHASICRVQLLTLMSLLFRSSLCQISGPFTYMQSATTC
jgi:hypothetical protein